MRTTSTLLLLTLPLSAARAEEPHCQDNPDVIYCNDFEAGTWDGMHHGSDAELVAGTAGASTFDGAGALVAHINTSGGGADAELGVRFAAAERVYVRFYVRWEGVFEHLNHWIGLHGDDEGGWSCHGNAGCRPRGLDCFTGSGVDLQEVSSTVVGEPHFYTYYPDMHCDSGGYCSGSYAENICDGCASNGLACEDGLECCWGNHFYAQTPITLVRDRWYHFEVMLKANSVDGGGGVADGEMSIWVDGALVAHHGDMLWRHTDAIAPNHFIAWNYNPDNDQTYDIRYDNLVISRAPVGPVGEGPGPDPDPEPDPGELGDGAKDEDASDSNGQVASSCAANASVAPLTLLAIAAWARRRLRRG